MTGDCHVRFCERLGAKLPWPTDLENMVEMAAFLRSIARELLIAIKANSAASNKAPVWHQNP